MTQPNEDKPRDQQWRKDLKKSMTAKERTLIERVRMPEVEPSERIRSNVEVNQGISAEMALVEAKRCLDCPDPQCIKGCPVNVDIPGFIKYVEAGDFIKAAETIKKDNAFPSVCGRVCPQETQCEARCMLADKLNKEAVAIGYLERFVADYARESENVSQPLKAESNGIKVAVIGSGPAGLAAAGDLAKMGYEVTVFEALHEFGGVLKYGIPEFRLPNTIIDKEIETLKLMGVTFMKNIIAGRTISFDDLKNDGFRAFFIGSGAGLPNFMNIPGENFNGVLSSNEYLTRVNLMGAARKGFDTPVFMGKKVAVIGGGNTAMDSVRTAKRLGAEKAMIIYRRSFNEMPARKEEIRHAIEEGIEFLNLHTPVEYFADETGHVNRIKLQRMDLSEPDESGRRKPVPVPGSEYEIEADMVIVSVGVSPNPLIPQSLPSLKVSRHGTILVDDSHMLSSIDGMYAGGDIVRGGATVILAMGDGRRAAQGIHEYLSGKS
ncbi:MAG TPA: NADPH-dependent glutamate synthase [Bacteroidales bacterium]|nr:NADPH-dependent glutamate synthase [Bacteroidales bacterium]